MVKNAMGSVIRQMQNEWRTTSQRMVANIFWQSMTLQLEEPFGLADCLPFKECIMEKEMLVD